MDKPMRPTTPAADAIRIVLAHIDRGGYPYPYRFDVEDGAEVLCLRTSDAMQHLRACRTQEAARAVAALVSDRAFKRALAAAGLLLMTPAGGAVRHVERTWWGKRISHMVAVRLAVLGAALPPGPPQAADAPPGPSTAPQAPDA